MERDLSFFGNAVCVSGVKDLIKPSSHTEAEECREVALAVSTFTLRKASIVIAPWEDTPTLWLQYALAPRPRPFWTRHLWIQITLEGCGMWLGRIAYLAAPTYEIGIVPRPDRTQPALSRHAMKNGFRETSTRIFLRLGTIYPPSINVRTLEPITATPFAMQRP